MSTLYSFILRFLLNLCLFASLYFDHEAFVLFTYWTPLNANISEVGQSSYVPLRSTSPLIKIRNATLLPVV